MKSTISNYANLFIWYIVHWTLMISDAIWKPTVCVLAIVLAIVILAGKASAPYQDVNFGMLILASLGLLMFAVSKKGKTEKDFAFKVAGVNAITTGLYISSGNFSPSWLWLILYVTLLACDTFAVARITRANQVLNQK